MTGRRALVGAVIVVVASVPGGAARATPTHVLRIATIAPDGTEWARLSRSFAREVELATHGEVAIKWYFGGIAGRESQMLARLRRGQLDGAASGGMLCQRLAPSLRVVRVVGLFRSRDEALYVLEAAAAKLMRQMENMGEQQDATLLQTLFLRQGMQRIEPTEALRAQFFEAARHAREQLGAALTPAPLLDEVSAWLADYRTEQHHR